MSTFKVTWSAKWLPSTEHQIQIKFASPSSGWCLLTNINENPIGHDLVRRSIKVPGSDYANSLYHALNMYFQTLVDTFLYTTSMMNTFQANLSPNIVEVSSLPSLLCTFTWDTVYDTWVDSKLHPMDHQMAFQSHQERQPLLVLLWMVWTALHILSLVPWYIINHSPFLWTICLDWDLSHQTFQAGSGLDNRGWRAFLGRSTRFAFRLQGHMADAKCVSSKSNFYTYSLRIWLEHMYNDNESKV